MCLHFSMQAEDNLEHIDVKSHCVPFWSTCRLWCGIGIHLITFQDIPMPRYQQVYLNAKCHVVTLMTKFLIISVNQHMPQNRVSDTFMHVTLNAINGVILMIVVRKIKENNVQVPMLVYFWFGCKHNKVHNSLSLPRFE